MSMISAENHGLRLATRYAVLTLIAVIGYMAWTDWRLTTIVLLGAPVIAFVLRRFGKRMRKATTGALVETSNLSTALMENLDGVRLIKIENREAAEEARVGEVVARRQRHVIKSADSPNEREVDLTFPADWRVADLAGKSAKVTLKVHKVSEPQLPAIDADFVKSFGIKSGKVDQFRQEVRANLERELKGTLMSRLRAEVASKLVAAYSSVELPPRLVQAEARNMAAAAEQQARQQGQANAKADPELFMANARNRVAAGLLVGEIARQNELKLDPRRLNETLQLIASTYEEPEQVVELYRNDPNLMSGLRNRVMEEQVIDWIAERAEATEQALSFTELMRPAA